MLEDPADLLELFLGLPAALASQRSHADLAREIARQARLLLCADRVDLYALDHTNRFLIPSASTAPGGGGTDEPIPLYDGGRRNSRVPVAYAAFSGDIIAVPDAYAFSGFDFAPLYARDRAAGQRTRAVVAFSMRDHNAMTIGVIEATDFASGNTARAPRAAEAAIHAFASMAAIAMTSLRLIEEKQQLIRRLGRSNDRLTEENEKLRNRAVHTALFPGVIGESQAMQQVFSLVARTLDSKVTVLLTGETGTGKEVMAQAIHANGSRGDAPFVVQNCAAMPEQLLESELFGYRRGAFTGAVENRTGLFQAADKGTLFLDEIGDMPLSLQGKILRVLQDSEVRPIGETKSRKVDVRIIAATHKDLREKVRIGEFREDLFYRLCVFPIMLPPLRERRADILPLVHHFLAQAAVSHGRRKPPLSTDAAMLLEDYAFPGNVRELRNAVERALLLTDDDGPIAPHHLPPEIMRATAQPDAEAPLHGPVAPNSRDLRSIVAHYEGVVISSMLEDHGWNQTRTAKELGISRRSLVEKIQRYGIKRAQSAAD